MKIESTETEVAKRSSFPLFPLVTLLATASSKILSNLWNLCSFRRPNNYALRGVARSATHNYACSFASSEDLTVSRITHYALQSKFVFALALLFLALPLWAFEATVLKTPEFTLTFSSESERIAYDTPFMGTLRMELPNALTPTLPDLQSRFRGIEMVEEYQDPPLKAGNRTAYAWHFRLTPTGEGPWGLRPFALRMHDARTGKTTGYATEAITFPAPLPLPPAAGEPEGELEPVWIAPSWKTVSLWVGAVLLPLGLLLLALPYLKRTARALHERTLSPEERARLELNRLLAQNLLAQGEFKRFYFELTGVLRRYFERSHGVRATRQTTPEFLALLAAQADFSDERRTAIAAFLEAADRIKFAGIQATASEAEAAISTAQAAIESDVAARQKEEAATHA